MTASNRRRFVLACQQAFAVAVVTTIAVPAASLLELDIVGPGSSDSSAPASAGAVETSVVTSAPVTPTVRSVPLHGVSTRGLRTLGRNSLTARRAADRFAVLSRPVAATGYATVGVTWAHGVRLSDDDISLSVRTRTGGTWSSWQHMDYDADHGPDPGSAEADAAARPGTDAVVVGDVDDVQIRATTADGNVPDDMQLAVVDPGADVAPRTAAPAIDTGALDEGASGDATLASSALTGPAMVTPKPLIFSREQWGADERMRDKPSLHYGEIHAGFVHHTVNANSYSKDQVPSLIRGIYAYHTQSKGWSDVGYNFLVDRFGQIWEGRYGGVDRPVVGAHTLGYNDDAFAMSAIGNFETARPPEAVIDAYARLFAWKLSLHGIDAASTKQWVTSRYFQAINGHRDAGQTACPGKYLYARIPDIRRKAEQLQRPFAARNRFGDLSGNAWPDLLARRSSDNHVVAIRTAGQVAFQPGITAATGWGSTSLRAAVGDVTGDGVGDLIAKLGSGPASLYPGDGKGGFGAALRTYDRFDSLDLITGVGDFDGDGRSDLVGRSAASHDLWLYPGRAGGGFAAAYRLARGVDDERIIGVDDFDGDGHRDLVAGSGSTLSLLRGTGTGLRARVALKGDWSAFDVVTGRGDLTGDGLPDLLARARSSKATWIFPGDGRGSFTARIGGFTRFAQLKWFVVGGNVAGTAARDVVGLGADGRSLRVFPHNGRRNLGRVVDTGIVLKDLNLLLNVGDWNADGHGDLMYRVASSGDLVLRRGLGGDRYAAPVRVAAAWNKVSMVAPVGDATGDGYPDLMARGSDGNIRIYPSNGRTGFRTSYVAHSAITADRQVGVGLFNGDGAPDNLLRKTDGTVWLWTGNGPGGLMSGTKVASGTKGYSWFKGIGDLDGDGRSDVVARDAAGSLWLLRGTATGLSPRRLLAQGFAGYDYAG